MKKLGLLIALAAGTLPLAVPAFSQNKIQQGQGQAIVTVLSKHGGEAAGVTQQELEISVDGKQASITKWIPLQGPDNTVELVLLIDDSASRSLGGQFGDISHFVQSLPTNVKATVAYMMNGEALLAGPLSVDHAQVVRELHLPGGLPGTSASPYFCLSDLAQHWPSQDQAARREVVMITDGIDSYYHPFDLRDPYVEDAISDSARARMVVFAIAWTDQGFAGRSFYRATSGQNWLLDVAQGTGGKSYWEGFGNPVALQPFLEDIARRLHNQYELGFVARLDGKPEVESLKLKINAPAMIVDAPQEVYVNRKDVTKG